MMAKNTRLSPMNLPMINRCHSEEGKMNLEKFWLAAGAEELKDGYASMASYAIMALPDGTEVAVENFVADSLGKWIWYEPIDMPIMSLINLMERWSGDDGFDIDYFTGTCS